MPFAKSVRSVMVYVPTTDPLAILESVMRLLRLLMPACNVCLPTLQERSSMIPSCCPRRPVGRDGPTLAKDPPLAPPSVKLNAADNSFCACEKSGTPLIAEYQLPLRIRLFTRRGVIA